MAKRTKSSQLWLERQRRDPYVKKAAAGGLGSRAHFKLAQLDERFSLLRPHMSVLELGSAPGGWTRYIAGACTTVASSRSTIGRCRFRAASCSCASTSTPSNSNATVDDALGGRKVDLVLSDMSPNISGVKACRSSRGDGSDRPRDGQRDAMVETCAARSWSRCFRAKAPTNGSRTCALLCQGDASQACSVARGIERGLWDCDGIHG